MVNGQWRTGSWVCICDSPCFSHCIMGPLCLSSVWLVGTVPTFHLAYWHYPFSVSSYIQTFLTLKKLVQKNQPLFCQLRVLSLMSTLSGEAAMLIIGWNHTALESLVVVFPEGTDVEVYTCNQLLGRMLTLLPRCAGNNLKACLHGLLPTCVNYWPSVCVA